MRALRLILLVIVGLWAIGCSHAMEYEADFHGRVLDESTKEPIKGVVVLATWNDDDWMGIAGPTSRFYTAAETLTDEKGEFTIEGRGIKVFSSIAPMRLTIFKAGYRYGACTALSMKEAAVTDPTRRDGKRAIIRLKKLSMEERMQTRYPMVPDEAKFEDVKMMLIEVDRERIARGYPPLGMWDGIKYEVPKE